MSNQLEPAQIVRAWKDEEFRSSLTEEQLAVLPPAPSNISELTEDELEAVAGGGCKCGCWSVTATESETAQ